MCGAVGEAGWATTEVQWQIEKEMTGVWSAGCTPRTLLSQERFCVPPTRNYVSDGGPGE